MPLGILSRIRFVAPASAAPRSHAHHSSAGRRSLPACRLAHGINTRGLSECARARGKGRSVLHAHPRVSPQPPVLRQERQKLPRRCRTRSARLKKLGSAARACRGDQWRARACSLVASWHASGGPLSKKADSSPRRPFSMPRAPPRSAKIHTAKVVWGSAAEERKRGSGLLAPRPSVFCLLASTLTSLRHYIF
jgi:hypothetical protein